LNSAPTVFVLVPIRNEPEDLVSRMLRHLAAVSYSNYHVLLIDNSSESHVERFRDLAVAAGLDCVHVLRKADTRGFKGGALNLALDKVYAANAPYVLLLDIDHAPNPQILTQLLPVLESNPRLAFVQAPQVYSTPVRSAIASAFMFKQRVFYNQICPGLSAAGCIFISGSNALIRTRAL